MAAAVWMTFFSVQGVKAPQRPQRDDKSYKAKNVFVSSHTGITLHTTRVIPLTQWRIPDQKDGSRKQNETHAGEYATERFYGLRIRDNNEHHCQIPDILDPA